METRDLILNSAFGEKSLMFDKMEMTLPSLHNISGMSKVQENITRMETASEDKILNLTDIGFTAVEMEAGDDSNTLKYQNVLIDDGVDQYPMSSWCLSQLSASLGVPASYVKKCIVEGASDLAIQNMDYWRDRSVANNPGKQYLVRLTDDRARGFLSDRYSAFDDSKFIDMVTYALPSDSEFRISNQIVSPDITKMRIIANDKMNIGGDDYSVGFDISNSRVGRSGIKLQLLIFRWICSNGMLMGGGKAELLHRMHKNVQELPIAVQIKLIMENMPELLVNIKDWTESSKSNKLNAGSLTMLTDGFRANVLNSEQAVLKIQAMMVERYNQSMWGYLQAITEVAQLYDVFTREAMEKYAGRLLQKSK